MFKIRNKTTGLFSSGGFYTKWTKTGKVWATRRALSGHISMIRDSPFWQLTHAMDDWEIIELEMVEKGSYSVEEFSKKKK